MFLAAPKILRAPASQMLSAGATVVLDTEATGTEPLGYQWYRNATNQLKDGVVVKGSTSNLLTLVNVLGPIQELTRGGKQCRRGGD